MVGQLQCKQAPNGEVKESTAVLMLKQTGTDITGTVGPSEDAQFAIQKGKIEGDKITLEADHEGHTMTAFVDLALAAGAFSGDVSMSVEGQTAKAKIEVTRGK